MHQQMIGSTAIVWKRSNLLLKIILAALIFFSVAAMSALGWVHTGIRAQTEALRREAIQLELENQTLERKIAALGTEASVRQIAKEELGMVSADTVLITPVKSTH